MQLPEREACFACGGRSKSPLWHGEALVLFACLACGSEWLEGRAAHEQAYRYDGYDGAGLYGRYYSARARRFVAYLSASALPAGDLLDIGCGPGEFLVRAKAMGWRPVGVELDEEAARAGRARSGVPVLAGDVAQTPLFAPQSFDVITLWGVLEHVPDPEALLRACCSLVRPHGTLLLETPSSKGMFRLVARVVMAATGGRFTRGFQETLGAGHVVWYSPRGLRATAERLGLRVIDLRASRNSSQILAARFAASPLVQRVPFQLATVLLNGMAAPLGRANQMLAALQL